MYVYMNVCKHVHMYTHMYMCMHTCIQACVQVCVYRYVCTCVCVQVRVYRYVWTCVCTCVCVHVCVYRYVCTCMCVHVCGLATTITGVWHGVIIVCVHVCGLATTITGVYGMELLLCSIVTPLHDSVFSHPWPLCFLRKTSLSSVCSCTNTATICYLQTNATVLHYMVYMNYMCACSALYICTCMYTYWMLVPVDMWNRVDLLKSTSVSWGLFEAGQFLYRASRTFSLAWVMLSQSSIFTGMSSPLSGLITPSTGCMIWYGAHVMRQPLYYTMSTLTGIVISYTNNTLVIMYSADSEHVLLNSYRWVIQIG